MLLIQVLKAFARGVRSALVGPGPVPPSAPDGRGAAVDQYGQVIDVRLSARRRAAAARAFFGSALTFGASPVEVTTDLAPVYPRLVDEYAPAARQVTKQYATNIVGADHGRLKAHLRPMRGLKTVASARTVAAGHAFVQNLRRGHDELTADDPVHDRSALPSRGSPTASEHRRRAAVYPFTQASVS